MVIYRNKMFINSLLAVMVIFATINLISLTITGSLLALIPLSIQIGVIVYATRRHERIINIIRLWALLPIIAGGLHLLYVLSGLALKLLTDNHRFEETSIVFSTIIYTFIMLLGVYYFKNVRKNIIPLRVVADDIEGIIKNGEIDDAAFDKYFVSEIADLEKVKHNILKYVDQKKENANSDIAREEQTKRMRRIVHMLRRNNLNLASKVEL